MKYSQNIKRKQWSISKKALQKQPIPQKRCFSTDLYKIQMLTLCDGIKEPNFADENLLKHFNAFTPIDIFEKLFLAGEVNDIYNKIAKLSGYDKDEKEKNIEEVKN